MRSCRIRRETGIFGGKHSKTPPLTTEVSSDNAIGFGDGDGQGRPGRNSRRSVRGGCPGALGAFERMSWGKSIRLAWVMAIICQAGLLAGEGRGHVDCPGDCGESHRGDVSLISLRKNAAVSIGGEFATDYTHQKSKTSSILPTSTTPPVDSRVSDLTLRRTNLRLKADVHPNISAFIKLDLSSGNDEYDDEIIEEAMLVMSAVGGTGLGFFAGKGRAPYGQDVAMGMLQSYHHATNRYTSSEGPIFINEPPFKDPDPAAPPAPPEANPVMRPGQIDRVLTVGASYEWEDRWKVELAAFQPGADAYRDRFKSTGGSGNSADIGAAARVWWRPFDDLVLQFSAVAARSSDMARVRLRNDLRLGARGTGTAYAVSAGFDWKRGPWQVFGEYQHGWDWNFTRGYDTDTWQVGVARGFGDNWRVAAVAEGLHIDDGGAAEAVRHDYCKLSLNVRYAFASGFFILAEYGHEWARRKQSETLAEKRRGDFFGIRVGMSF